MPQGCQFIVIENLVTCRLWSERFQSGRGRGLNNPAPDRLQRAARRFAVVS